MQKRLAALVLAMIMLGGCGKPAAAPVRAAEPEPAAPVAPAPAPAVPTPDELLSEGARRSLTLDQLRDELERYLNGPGAGTAAERIGALHQAWGVQPKDDGRIARVPFAEADLDGDGTPELAVAFNTYGQWHTMPTGTIFVISRTADGYRVDKGAPPEVAYVHGVSLLGTADLTGDGQPEIVWVAEDQGAHTSTGYVYVSRWQPGKVETLPGAMTTSFAAVRIDGKDLVLQGGVVGSAGAGLTQRASTDRYRWIDGAFRLADREYDPSDWAYHRIVDGIAAETYGHPEKAEAAYRSAIEPDRKPLPDRDLPPEWLERFGQAVPVYARFRLGLFLARTGRPAEGKVVLQAASGPYAGLAQALAAAPSPDEGCRAASAWAAAHGEFLDALNAPYGYHNFQWSAADLCGPLPRDMK